MMTLKGNQFLFAALAACSKISSVFKSLLRTLHHAPHKICEDDQNFLADRHVHRRVSVLVAYVQQWPLLQYQREHVRVPELRAHVQRRVPVRVLRFNVRAVRNEQRDNLQVTAHRRDVQRRAAGRCERLHICAVLKQHLRNLV